MLFILNYHNSLSAKDSIDQLSIPIPVTLVHDAIYNKVYSRILQSQPNTNLKEKTPLNIYLHDMEKYSLERSLLIEV